MYKSSDLVHIYLSLYKSPIPVYKRNVSWSQSALYSVLLPLYKRDLSIIRGVSRLDLSIQEERQKVRELHFREPLLLCERARLQRGNGLHHTTLILPTFKCNVYCYIILL